VLPSEDNILIILWCLTKVEKLFCDQPYNVLASSLVMKKVSRHWHLVVKEILNRANVQPLLETFESLKTRNPY
jgi:galactose-1-phosphate uridylyltransferase